MRVLITGATGCLGGALVRRLAGQANHVTATGRNPSTGALLVQAGARFTPADLRVQAQIEPLVAGQEVVFHCGGLSSAWGRASEFHAANVIGTRHVVDACRRHGVRRLIFVSTPSVYFDFTDRLDVRETDALPPRPVNAYAASKLAAEKIISAAVENDLDAVIIRPRAIFGPGDSALLPRLLRVAARGRLPLIDGGRAVIDLTFVENVVDALVALASASPRLAGGIYNISNGQPQTVATLFSRIIAAAGLKVRLFSMPFRLALAAATALELAARFQPGRPEPLLTRYTVGVLGKSQTLSLAAARRDFGYSPRVELFEAIDQTMAVWRAAHA